MICLSDQPYALSLASPFTIIYCAHLTNGRCDLTLFDPGGGGQIVFNQGKNLFFKQLSLANYVTEVPKLAII